VSIVERLWRAKWPIFVLVIFVLFVTKCVPRPINDLEVLNVSRLTDQQSIKIRRDIQDTTGFEVSHAILWHVQLSGNANWINEVQKHELNGYFIAKNCAHQDWGIFGYGPFADGTEVGAYGESIENVDVSERPTIIYDVYIPETGRYRSAKNFNSKQPTYNLNEDLVEICLSIAGGAMHGAYGKSNEVRFHLKS